MNRIISLLRKYLTKYLSTKIVFLVDMIMSVAASIGTILLVKLMSVNDFLFTDESAVWLICSALFSFSFIWGLRTYRIIIRHSTIKELGFFILVALFKQVMSGFVFGLLFGFDLHVLILMIVDFFLTFSFFFLVRIFMTLLYDAIKGHLDQRNQCQNVLIYGISEKSVSIISRLASSPHYKIVGFVQFGKQSVSHVISEIKVNYVDSAEAFQKVVSDVDADALLFAYEDDVRAESDRLVRYAIDAHIKTLIAPSIDEMVDGKLSYKLRNIEIEDLLMREEIKISMDEIVENFQGKTVMVTGAAGSIGSELCRQLATFGVEKLILFDNAETPMHNLRLEFDENFPDVKYIPIIGDVRLPARLDYAFRKFRPQVVFHAAAYKHVPLMEENPCEAVLVNVAGSRNVADKCLEYDVEKMVMVSTDKAVNPTNIMGCTKRLAEIYVQSMGLAMEQGKKAGRTKFVTTRFGNVLGSNGSVIPRFREQIAKGGPVTVTHPEITRFFMTIPEACRLVMEAATMSTGNQIFVFDMGESIKIDVLARRMIRLAGFTPDKDIMVQYSGLRPGEKLYEEVLSDHENTLPTDHSRIRIAKVREYDYAEAISAFEKLEHLSREVEIEEMVKLMKDVVPEFISQNSMFAQLDCHPERSEGSPIKK